MKCAPTQKEDMKAVKELTHRTWISTYMPMGISIDAIKSRYQNPLWDTGFYNYIERKDSISYCVFNEEFLIGVVSAYTKDDHIVIFSFNVDNNYQRKGIGTILLNKIKELNKDIILSTLEENTQAQKFYEHHGFVKTGKISPFRFSDDCIKNDIEYIWKANTDTL